MSGATFNANRKWALLTGPEGSGKSTLLRVVKARWPSRGRVGPPLDANLRVEFMPAPRNTGLRFGSFIEAAAYPDKPDHFDPGSSDSGGPGTGEARDSDCCILNFVTKNDIITTRNHNSSFSIMGNLCSCGRMDRYSRSKTDSMFLSSNLLDLDLAEEQCHQPIFKNSRCALPAFQIMSATMSFKLGLQL